MTERMERKLLDLKARQQAGEHMPCPRCGKDRMKEPVPVSYTHLDVYKRQQDTMRRYLKEFEDEYMVYRGTVQARPPLSGTSQVP